MDGGCINIDRQTMLRNAEVGYGDGRLILARRHGHLLFGVKVMLFEETQELEFQRRAYPNRV